MDINQNKGKQHHKTVIKLVAASAAMFAFALFVLPPLYDVLCDVTGLNGRLSDGGRVSVEEFNKQNQQENADERLITVQFLADTNSHRNWTFKPQTRSIKVSPGSIHQIFYRVENPYGREVVAQAIPSVTPARATAYLKKTQCFCFERQPLKAFEGKDMGLVFYVDPELPDSINTLTLSYSLFDISEQSAASSNNTTAITQEYCYNDTAGDKRIGDSSNV